MALPGMKSTGDFAADEHPKSWREGILKLLPRNSAKLYALTAAMKSEKVNYPQFYWWEEPMFLYTFTTGEALDNSETEVTLAAGAQGKRLKEGDVLKIAETGEHIRVTSIVSDTSINVTRAFGDAATAAGTAAAAATAGVLIYIGSAYREGADKAIGVSTSPTKQYNYTQIFRDPVEITRTAMQSTGWRTGDPFANDKARVSHKHAVGVERAFWFGDRYETTESSQPLRTTGGLLSFLPADNSREWALNGNLTMTDLEDRLATIFQYGSGEKLAFTSIQVISLFSRMARINGQFTWESGTKEYGMDVRRFMGPAGSLVLTEHPLFSHTPYLQNDVFIIDTDNIRYRHLQDTTYLKNRHGNGVDGKTDEFLTECGLEFHHPNTHYHIQGVTGVALDD